MLFNYFYFETMLLLHLHRNLPGDFVSLSGWVRFLNVWFALLNRHHNLSYIPSCTYNRSIPVQFLSCIKGHHPHIIPFTVRSKSTSSKLYLGLCHLTLNLLELIVANRFPLIRPVFTLPPVKCTCRGVLNNLFSIFATKNYLYGYLS